MNRSRVLAIVLAAAAQLARSVAATTDWPMY